MATFKKLLWTLAAIPLLTACSNDDFPGQGGSDSEGKGEGVFMTVNFTPVNKDQTRSYTDKDNHSSSGVEIGRDVENQINGVLIVLASRSETPARNNRFIAASYVDNRLTSNADYTIYQATAKFGKTSIAGYYSTITLVPGTNPSVNVFIYCNPSDRLKTFFLEELKAQDDASKWVNQAYELASATDDALWKITGTGETAKGNFMMTNVSNARRFFPQTLEAWNLYGTEANPFDLSGMNNEGTDNEVDNISGQGGSINVHRNAVRFDFCDGSQLGPEDGYPNGNGVKGTANTYNVMVSSSTTGGVTTVTPLVQATIVNMSLVNLLNKEYYLGRTSSNGLDENITLLGAEKNWFTDANGTQEPDPDNETGYKLGNYVVSPWAAEKNAGIESGFSTYFYSPFFDENGTVDYRNAHWQTDYLSDVLAADKPDDGTMHYKIWRYATENTIPGENENQTEGQSTGVVFKAKLKGAEGLQSGDQWDKMLYAALNNASNQNRNPEKDPILYLFSGKLYCTWEHVQAAALAAAGFDANKGQNQDLDRSSTLFRAVYGEGGVGEVKDSDNKVIFKDDEEADSNSANSKWAAWVAGGRPGSTSQLNLAFKEAVVNATFTIYQTSEDKKTGWGYYCYYYYWNRHNDNGDNGNMGPMEFATVRNNVYKLAVTRLNTLGHPRIPENDPDKPTPDTPDEKDDLYLTVSVQVVPWVVRFNNIEFW